MCNIMTTADQIDEFIEKYKIKEELKNLFEVNCSNLEFRDKKYAINIDEIKYEKSVLDFHLFKTPIFKNEQQIGYFAIEHDQDFDVVDDFFVIFDEIGTMINKIAHDKIDFKKGSEIILQDPEFNFAEIFDILQQYILNSIPDKTDYNSKEYQNAIKTIPLKQTITPIVILQKFSTKIAFNKLKKLPESEHKNIIIALLWIFKVTDSKRRETECKDGCEHSWHNIK